MKCLLRFVALSVVCSFAWCNAQAQSASRPLGNLSAYLDAGYLSMAQIYMPLLHTARTGQPIDKEAMLAFGANSLLPEQRALWQQVRQARDEFQARDPRLKLDKYLDDSVQLLKDSGGYLISAQGTIKNYDFARKGFPIEFSFGGKVNWSKEALFCSGRLGQHEGQRSEYLTACLRPGKFQSDSTYSFLPVPDEAMARAIRNKSGSSAMQVYAVAHADGRYEHYAQGKPYGGSLFEKWWVAGVQPVKVVQLLFVESRTGEILAAVAPESQGPGAETGAHEPAFAGLQVPMVPRLGQEVLALAPSKPVGAPPTAYRKTEHQKTARQESSFVEIAKRRKAAQDATVPEQPPLDDLKKNPSAPVRIKLD